MITRRSQSDVGTDAPVEPIVGAPQALPQRTTAPGTARPSAAPRSSEEAEAQYVAARDAWTTAMRRASSGRPADLASLAIAQEAFERASLQRSGWEAGGRGRARMAIPIRPSAQRSGIDVFVNQDLAWRRIRDAGNRRPNPLARLMRRLTGRG